MIKELKDYYKQLDKEHEEYRNKYKEKEPKCSGFQYSKNKEIPKEDREKIKNIKEQKLHIKRLIKLIEEEN